MAPCLIRPFVFISSALLVCISLAHMLLFGLTLSFSLSLYATRPTGSLAV